MLVLKYTTFFLILLQVSFIFVLCCVVDVSEFHAQLESHDLLDHFVIFIVHNIGGSGAI